MTETTKAVDRSVPSITMIMRADVRMLPYLVRASLDIQLVVPRHSEISRRLAENPGYYDIA